MFSPPDWSSPILVYILLYMSDIYQHQYKFPLPKRCSVSNVCKLARVEILKWNSEVFQTFFFLLFALFLGSTHFWVSWKWRSSSSKCFLIFHNQTLPFSMQIIVWKLRFKKSFSNYKCTDRTLSLLEAVDTLLVSTMDFGIKLQFFLFEAPLGPLQLGWERPPPPSPARSPPLPPAGRHTQLLW